MIVSESSAVGNSRMSREGEDHLAPPLAFISHASEDHDFVVNLASTLRTDHGIDAWIDDWEMLPGDSLIDKVFSQGIGKASAIIVVLSGASVEKPWVKEEINSSFVRKVEDKIRLIPVILDSCQMPECLRATVHVRVADRAACDDEMRRIAMGVHGVYEKPEVGPAPGYVRVSSLASAYGLATVDVIVLEAACERAWECGDYHVGPRKLVERLAAEGLGEEQVFESLDVLDGQGHLECDRLTTSHTYPGAGIGLVSVPGTTMVEYAKQVGRRDEILRAEACIAGEEPEGSADIAAKADLDVFLCRQVLRWLDEQGHIECSEVCGGEVLLNAVSTPFRRAVRNR